MNEVKNKSGTARDEIDGVAIKKELRRTVQDYSKVIDMIDATPHFEEPVTKPQVPPPWRKLFNRIFRNFKTK